MSSARTPEEEFVAAGAKSEEEEDQEGGGGEAGVGYNALVKRLFVLATDTPRDLK